LPGIIGYAGEFLEIPLDNTGGINNMKRLVLITGLFLVGVFYELFDK
jgi:hypothetical protein